LFNVLNIIKEEEDKILILEQIQLLEEKLLQPSIRHESIKLIDG